MSQERDWQVDDSYTIIEDGESLVGIILEIKDGKYRVGWSNGDETWEDKISPAMERRR